MPFRALVSLRVVALSPEQAARAQRLLDDHLTMLVRAKTTEHIVRARQNGRIAFIPSLEAATPIETRLDRMNPGPQNVHQLT